MNQIHALNDETLPAESKEMSTLRLTAEYLNVVYFVYSCWCTLDPTQTNALSVVIFVQPLSPLKQTWTDTL